MTGAAGARVAVIGLGGMGIRHVAACKRIGAQVVAICDTREEARARACREAPDAEAYQSVEDCVAAVAHEVDLVSIVTNTPARASIMEQLLQAGARRVLTEKPFTTNVADAWRLTDAYERAGVPLTVNTFRHFCPDYLELRRLLRSGQFGQLRHIGIQSASTGLGNMGSVFFDVMNFYVESQPVEIIGHIDATGTPSVRGLQFRDPGGFGMVRYENGARGFLDTSEDTGVPYTFHFVTTYGRIFIDELLNRWSLAVRREGDKTGKPLTDYLAPLVDVPFEVKHGYDPVVMSSFTIMAALEDRPEASNARQAATVMEMIMAMHVSDAEGGVPVSLPLDKRHHQLELPFA